MDEKTTTPPASNNQPNSQNPPLPTPPPPAPTPNKSPNGALDELLKNLGGVAPQPPKTSSTGPNPPPVTPKPPVPQGTGAAPARPPVSTGTLPPPPIKPRPNIVPPPLPPRPAQSAPPPIVPKPPLPPQPNIPPKSPPPPTITTPPLTPPPPIPSRPNPPSNAPKPVPQQPPSSPSPSTPATSSPQDLSFRSSIRTMKDDLASVKKGVPPEGVELESVKHPASAIPSQTGQTKPAMPVPSQPQVHVELGETKKTAPLKVPGITPPAPSKLPPSPPNPNLDKISPPANLVVPSTKSAISKRTIIFVIVGIVVIGGGVLAFLFIKNREVATTTPTPSESIAPTQTPLGESPIDLIFGGDLASITLPEAGEPYSLLKNFVDNHSANIGATDFYKITTDTGVRYSFPAFLSRFNIVRPEPINTTDSKSELLFSTYENISKKNIGLIIPIGADSSSVLQAMRDWEQTIPASFQSLFGISPQKRASSVFLDNVYRGVSVRYLNFPDPDTTIDYAIVNLTPEINLLIITNSRDHIYSIIDQSQGF